MRKPRNIRAGSLRLERGRTSNPQEIAVVTTLQKRGWKVYKRGWPDLIAVKAHAVRFIEVKPAGCGLSAAQREVAEILAWLGITVEVVSPEDLGVKPLILPNTYREIRS